MHVGRASHSLEYGFPSAHVACAVVIAYHASTWAQSVLTSAWWLEGTNPEPVTHLNGWQLGTIAGVSIAFVLKTAAARYILGVHWLADLIGGAFLGVAVMAASASRMLPSVVEGLFSSCMTSAHQADAAGGPPWWWLCAPWMAMWLALAAHPTPAGPCPCIEDSVRFFGVDAGLVFGMWMRCWLGFRGWHVPFQVNARDDQPDAPQPPPHVAPPTTSVALPYRDLFSMQHVGLLLVSLVVAVGLQSAVSPVLNRLVRPSLRWLSGASLRTGGWFALPVAPGCAIPVVVVSLEGATPNSVAGPEERTDPVGAASRDVESVAAGSAGAPPQQVTESLALAVLRLIYASLSVAFGVIVMGKHKHVNGAVWRRVWRLVRHRPTAAPAAAAAFSEASLVSPDAEGAPNLVADDETISLPGADMGVLWSLRNHTHWHDADVVARFVSYGMLAVAVTVIAPIGIIGGTFVMEPPSPTGEGSH